MKVKKHKIQHSSLKIPSKQRHGRLSFADKRIGAIVQAKLIGDIQKQNKVESPIQLYTKDHQWKYSEGGLYATNDTEILYAAPNAPSPKPSEYFIQGNDGEDKTYKFKKNVYGFINDCGEFASGLVTRDTNYFAGDQPTKNLLLDGSTNEILDSNTQEYIATSDNYTMATGYSVNPNIGEAYFSQTNEKYELENDTEGYEYHVASVVAKDGSDNITCEANSGYEYSAPHFDMYGTLSETEENKEQTFHGSMGADSHKTVKGVSD